MEIFRHLVYIGGDHVVWQDVFGEIEPELGHLGQDLALVSYGVVEDHIKAADAVGGYHDQAVTIVIDFAYLSFFNRFHLFIPRCA